ncbi:MAG: hypothetical protein ACKO45_05150 [Cyanobium sp.]
MPGLRVPSSQGELGLSADDHWIGWAGIDGVLTLWQRQGDTYRNGNSIQVSSGPLSRLTFSPSRELNKQVLAALSLDGTASLWTLNGQQLARFREEAISGRGYLNAEFDENGANLLLWTKSGMVRKEPIWDLDGLIHQGCLQLKAYLNGMKTRQEDKKSLRFCTSPHLAWGPSRKN